MKKLIFLGMISFFVMPTSFAKTPVRKPNMLENLQTIKVRVRVRETQSLFEIKAEANNTLIIFHSQFGKTQTTRSPKRDFSDLGNIFLAPVTQIVNCKGMVIEAEAFLANDNQPHLKVDDCYNGVTASSKEKTQAVRILARLAERRKK
jgi:hypothetical protein